MNEHKRLVLLHLEKVLQESIEPHFHPDARISLIVRLPGNEVADVMITQEDPSDYHEVAATVMRQAERPDNRELVGGTLQ